MNKKKIMTICNKLPQKITRLAKKYKVNVKRDPINCLPNTGASAGKNIWLGKFDDKGCELMAFFHELGHIKSNIGNRDAYMSTLSKEGMAWEIGLTIASKNGHYWGYDSKAMKWARQQYKTYFNSEYNELNKI